MKGPYIDENKGEVYVERGDATWNKAQHEARNVIVGEWQFDAMTYLGIVDCTVSDEREEVHIGAECRESIEDDMPEGERLPDDWQPCCREVKGYHFKGVER